MTEYAGIPEPQPDFELPGECCVYPWGISWNGGDDSARWEEIIEVSVKFCNPIPVSNAAPTCGVAPIFVPVGGGPTWWNCKVTTTSGNAVFSEDHPRGHAWVKRRKPGETVRVNIRQLGRIIKKEVERSRTG